MVNEYGIPLDRNGYAPSIVPDHSPDCCFLCGRAGNLDRHEVYHGAYRDQSKRLGLWVYLCHDSCHIFGRYAVHHNGQTDRELKRRVQSYAMERYGWTKEEFVREFGKNYL